MKASLYAMSALAFLILLSCSLSDKKTFHQAENLFSKKKYERAARLYEKALIQIYNEKERKIIYQRLATVYHWFLYKYDKALFYYQLFEELAEDAQESVRAKKNIADIFQTHFKEFEKSVAMYHDILCHHSLKNEFKADIYLSLGHCHNAQKKFSLAREAYSHVLELNPKPEIKERVQYLIGTTHFIESNYVKAIEYYNVFLKEFPYGKYSEKAMLNRAKAFEENGDLKEALLAYDKVIERNPTLNVVRMKVDQVRKRLAVRGL